jgi:predicted Rossmann-fold nucleotide-binding protein
MVTAQRIQVHKLLVCGGREYGDTAALYAALDAVHKLHPELKTVIHGAARGADSLAAKWASERGLTHEPHPADWNKHPKAAGIIRNQKMLERASPQAAVAFPGGNGTLDMIKRLTLAKVPCWIPYKFDHTS